MTMKLNTPRALAGLTLLLAPLAAFTPPVHAQCPQDTYVEAWVDPFYGNNATGMVRDITKPFQTISAAITAVGSSLGNDEEGLVHALPGLYARHINNQEIGEQFPIRMQSRVHVQGAGAKETVIRARAEDENQNFMSVYWPENGNPHRGLRLVAVDFSQATGLEPVMFDGFTIQGADIQVYAESLHDSPKGRVSNCVFDMRHGGEEDLEGPSFGQMTVRRNIGEKMVRYEPVFFHTFNNTFLQGYRYGEGPTEVDLARPEAVAICDVNDPESPSGIVDPGPIRGLNDLHIQNNEIRCLSGVGQQRTALLGIDAGDTGVVVPAPTTQTNAFDSLLVGGVSVDPLMTFSSAIVGSTPTPKVDLGLGDPGYVGECVSFMLNTFNLDLRKLMDSILIDQGVAPVFASPTACTAELRAINNQVYLERRRTDSALGSFDFDGEGIGNPRVVGNAIDIGFDEVDSLVIAGCYGNNTKSHHLPYDTTQGVEITGVPRIPTGHPERFYFTATPRLFMYWLSFKDIVLPTSGPGAIDWFDSSPWTHLHGALPFQNTAPTFVSPWLDTSWATPHSATIIDGGSYTSTANSWTNWESGQLHSFGIHTWLADEILTPHIPWYFGGQTFHIQGTSIVSSNLSSEYF